MDHKPEHKSNDHSQHHSLHVRRDIWGSFPPPSHSMQGYCQGSINLVLKTSRCGKSSTSPTILFILEDKFTLISNLQLPSHCMGLLALVVPGATTKKSYRALHVGNSSSRIWRGFQGTPRLPLLTAPWELHVPWTAQHPGSPLLEPSPVFHCSPWAGDPNSGHTIHDNMALMLYQNTLSPSFLTLAGLLFFTASSHQH